MSDKKKFKIKIQFGRVSIILIAVFAALLAVDLILKTCYETYDWNFTVIPRLIYVENSTANRNYGAAFSFLSDTQWGRIFFIIITFIMLIVMAVAFLALPERFVILKTALVMVASGALGNLIDRLAFGYVRDFVWVNIFGNWACCNFADFWIVFGVILGIIDILFLNEWAVLPLTKKARAAARLHKEEEQAEKTKELDNIADNVQTPQDGNPSDNPESNQSEGKPDGGKDE